MLWQIRGTLVVAAVLLIWEAAGTDQKTAWWGFPQTVAALAAGLACIIPAGFYAWRATIERSATRFLLQGVLKFALTLVLVAACIILIKPAAAGFFGTLILLQLMYVAAPLGERGAR